ncbi:MAG: DUF1638 domain-containing protein [Planctomycetota bacterium]|nr:DUF1638 domain-containing protein [Planctomycetota bacterium]MCX8040714.1 DUF1638 domain-containing protein [Planctomycetota bacterium]MDW8372329.1 DUF1638 domain-containing protein [Planctomycetota bacterium]
MNPERLLLIACAVFTRELSAAIAASSRQVDVQWLPKDLHERGGAALRAALQERCDRADPAAHDAIALGFALCNNGLIGLAAQRLPIVAPRSHDCIACLLGSRARYEEEFRREPGTYWFSSGWLERSAGDPLASPCAPAPGDPAWRALVERYGEDNARYLWEQLHGAAARYTRLIYIDTACGPQERFAALAAERAHQRGLRFARLAGDPRWLQALLDGPWDEERFVVVPPGHRIVATHDQRLMAVAALADAAAHPPA